MITVTHWDHKVRKVANTYSPIASLLRNRSPFHHKHASIGKALVTNQFALSDLYSSATSLDVQGLPHTGRAWEETGHFEFSPLLFNKIVNLCNF
jgi:hypothetical protein